MLLTEDGHLDIKRVKQLNEEKLTEEMEDWGEDQWYEWDHKDGSMSVKDFFNLLRKEIKDMYTSEE